RSRAAEIRVGVDGVYAALADSSEIPPSGDLLEVFRFFKRPPSIESAGHKHDDLRIGLGNRVPARAHGVLARVTENLPPARGFDEFRDPVPGRVRRIEPFHGVDLWMRQVPCLFTKRVQPFL